ncbi:universal stress protein [Halegenticoccus soli]|uniref:universal stress protein n=1 Tax=Halegenticoccus soli TaxID=1985678 RepID=UPI000C6EE60D|nr:universal stress protein [Halegenticoccus soli]
MYERILIPTDGSETARSAVQRAVDFARRYDATLHALYVVDTAAFGTADFDADVMLEGFEQEGKRAVEYVAEAARDAAVPVETAIVHGSPERTILRYADDNDIDLIVMGTHGRRGLERYLLGSTTERIVRSATVPVLTVRHHREGTEAAEE